MDAEAAGHGGQQARSKKQANAHVPALVDGTQAGYDWQRANVRLYQVTEPCSASYYQPGKWENSLG